MRILISDKLEEEGIKILENQGFEVVKKFSITPEELKQEIGNYNGVIIRSRTKLTSEILDNAKNLKVIGRAGVGLDNVDLIKAGEMNIKVFNTPDAPSDSVAELAICLMLSLARHVSKADKTMHRGKWCKNDYMGFILKEKKVGLIGFGNIGQAVAKKCAALEMDVGIFDILPELIKKAKNMGYTVYSSIEDLIKSVQIISLHIPANKHTENIINQEKIRLMSKNTILINTARGALVDEQALVKALKNKEIGGAGLDVFKEEPTKNNELCDWDEHLILTPHIGSSTEETQISAAISIAEQIAQFLKK
ncbi:MAG: hydroxyacid dehydrogenase [Candidatus Lokiarchaeota archaeon]|nr:hydroxyacid dehydrogenase [Candidatus Lokiarchaeota archaeon]